MSSIDGVPTASVTNSDSKVMRVGFTEERDNYTDAELVEMTPEEVASIHLSYAMGKKTGHCLVVGWFGTLDEKWLFRVNDLCNWVGTNWRKL